VSKIITFFVNEFSSYKQKMKDGITEFVNSTARPTQAQTLIGLRTIVYRPCITFTIQIKQN